MPANSLPPAPLTGCAVPRACVWATPGIYALHHPRERIRLNTFRRLHQQTGLGHLFTTRNLSGNVIGIAWLGSLCEDFYGTALSQLFTTNQAALTILVAHEIGHNFNAPHDNQAGSPCQSTPFGFIMNPFISLDLRQEFSTCSEQRMAPEITGAACVMTVEPPPPAVPTPIAPRNIIRDTTPTMEWSAVAGAKRYTLLLRDTTTRTKVFRLNLSARDGTSYTVTTPLDPTHKFIWRVRARVNDEWGAFSDWMWFRFASGVVGSLRE